MLKLTFICRVLPDLFIEISRKQNLYDICIFLTIFMYFIYRYLFLYQYTISYLTAYVHKYTLYNNNNYMKILIIYTYIIESRNWYKIIVLNVTKTLHFEYSV